MVINKKRIKLAITDILLLLCSVLYFIGIKHLFPVCPVSGDKVMNCHWAGEVLSAVSILLMIISAVHIVIPDEKIKAGMDITAAGIAVLSMLIPGNIIPLCKSSEMMCRNGTSIWTMIIMIMLCLIAAADLFIYLQSASGKKHKRKAAGEKI